MQKGNWIEIFAINYRANYGQDSISDAFLNVMNTDLLLDFGEKTGIDIGSSNGMIILIYPLGN